MEIVAQARQAWDAGLLPDARDFLDRHPSVRRHEGTAIDLIYEEFCRRREAGEAIDPVEFAERFPTYCQPLYHRMRLDGWLAIIEGRIPTSGPPDLSGLWPISGQTFSGFTVLRELGRGAFACVYLATETAIGDRPVVLKMTLKDNPEPRTLGRLSHENIVPVLTAGVERETGLTLLCMPYLGSATLHDVLDYTYSEPDTSPPLSARVLLDAVQATVQPGDPRVHLGEPAFHLRKGTWINAVVRLGEQLAAALAFAHGQGILHRDIKPSNILVDAIGRPRLLDFNLSEDERLASKYFGGTPAYMAPEQLRLFLKENRDGEELDGRADVFGLAVILYELLAGKHPFGRMPPTLKEPKVMVRFLLERQQIGYTPLRTWNPRVDRRLAALIESCLAFEVKDRPVSAAELATALRRRIAPPRDRQILAGVLGTLLIAGAGVAALPLVALKSNRIEAPAPLPSAAEEYQAGCQAHAAGNFPEAEDHFQHALTLRPNHVPTLFACGRNALAQKQDALTYLKRACDLQPDNGQIWAARAYAELLRQDVDQSRSAIFSSEQALKAGFQTKETVNNLAYAHLELREFEQAEKYVNLALQMDPDYVPARFNRALVLYRKWLKEKGLELKHQLPVNALEDIRFVLAKNSQYASLHVLAARLYGACADSPHSPLAEQGRLCIREAVVLHGQDLKPLRADPVIKQRLGAKDYQLFENLPPAAANKPALVIPLSLQVENPIQDWLK